MSPMPPPGAKPKDTEIAVSVGPTHHGGGKEDSYFSCPSCGAKLCAEPMDEASGEQEPMGEGAGI